MLNILRDGLTTLIVTMIASIMLILLSILYFGLTMWVVKVASNFFFGQAPDANYAVLSAAIIAVGGILAGAIENKGTRRY
jgi:type IV secretory pathway TrbL component